MDRAEIGAPEVVRELVAIPARKWNQRSRWIDLLAFGSFRNAAKTIIGLSDFLAPIYLEHEILPIVRPVTAPHWHQMVEANVPGFQRIREKGLLTFARERL